MSRSEHDSPLHLKSPLYSRPESNAHSRNQGFAHSKPRSSTTTLNVLFLGETNTGKNSDVIDLIAGSREQKRTRYDARRELGDDVRSVALGDKIFKLYASPTNESMAPVALRERIRDTLMNLRRDGGVHLLVYCMNASHSPLWIHEFHRAVASNLTQTPRIPVVAVIAGTLDVAQQESWWSDNESSLVNQGLHFDDHTFIQMPTMGIRSSAGDHISERRRELHAFILQNCASTTNSEMGSGFERTALYRQRSLGNSLQSLLVVLARKPSSHAATGSKAIHVILLGEVGVGKSSLVNLVARGDVAGVSSDTVGCTQTAAKYTFKEKSRTFHIYDTPGLVDPQMGIQPFVEPVDIIQKLIRSLDNGNGPDLFLLCVDNSKPTVALQRNYRLFCKIICEGRVPFALAITKLEEGQSADQWWSRYRAQVRRYGVDCLGHVGLGREKRYLDPSLDSEGQLRESILSLLVACTDRQKNRINSLRSSMGRMVGSATSFLRLQVPMLEKTLMDQCGLEEQTAQELANRILSSRQSR